MASIHKRPGTPFYHAAWRGKDGRLFLRSTKQADRSKAMAVALDYERAEKMAMAGDLTETQARKVLSDILERTNTGDTLRAPSAANYLNSWLASKEISTSAGTVEKYGKTVREFLKHLGDFATKPITSLAVRHFETFLAKRTKQKCSPTTVTIDGKILRAAFTKARRNGLIPSNPAEGADLPGIATTERGVFTPAEINTILAATTDPEWRTLIMVGFYTGQRLSDCTRMVWADVNLQAGTWTLRQGKTNTKLTVPIHPELLAHLESLANGETAPTYVMPHMYHLGPGGRHGLSEGFKRICTKAGVDVQSVQGGGRRKICRRTFHALRHSFNSALMNAGVAQELRMKLTGHKSKEVNTGYSHAETETLRAAVAKMPGLGSKPAACTNG